MALNMETSAGIGDNWKLFFFFHKTTIQDVNEMIQDDMLL